LASRRVAAQKVDWLESFPFRQGHRAAASTVCLGRRLAAGALAGQDAVRRQSVARFRASFRGRVRDCLSATGEKARQGVHRLCQVPQRLDVPHQAEFQPVLLALMQKAQPDAARWAP
jgi:hypothetical protein